MEVHTEIAASSAVLEEWDETLSYFISARTLPEDSDAIIRFAKYRSPLNHPVTIFRKSMILAVGGYPPFRSSQDYALWSLLLTKGYLLANLPDVLYKQRAGNSLLNRRGIDFFRKEMRLLKYQREIGFITVYEYLRNTVIRFILRMSPKRIKLFLYNSQRTKMLYQR
jgi:hypothetical protein